MTLFSEAEEKRYAELQLMALDFAREGETKALEGMIDAGLPVNLSDHRGNSLLMLAAYNNNVQTLKMLIGKGADVDRRNDHAQTPLSGVAFKGYLEVCKLLVDAGADLNGKSIYATPLTFARIFGRVEVTEYLKSAGAKGTFGFLQKPAKIVRKLIKLSQ